MPFVTEYPADGARLVLSGDVGVVEAAALHAALVELQALDGRVTVDESRVHGCDVTLLQLIVAFARARRRAGRAFGLVAGPATTRLRDLGLGAEIAGEPRPPNPL